MLAGFFILEDCHETGRKLQISRPQFKKMGSSQSCSHRSSAQNGPVDKFTALTGTTFVTISVFMPRGHFPATFGKLLVNVWANLWQLSGNFHATFGQLSVNFRATKTSHKKRVKQIQTLTFLIFWSRSEGLLFFAESFFELIPGVSQSCVFQ